MAAGYEVQYEAMAKGARAVEDAANLISGHLRTLDGEVQTMLGGWKSQASQTFTTVHTTWVEQQQKLQTALVDMHSALVATGQTYSQQEEQQSSQFSGIAGQL